MKSGNAINFTCVFLRTRKVSQEKKDVKFSDVRVNTEIKMMKINQMKSKTL